MPPVYLILAAMLATAPLANAQEAIERPQEAEPPQVESAQGTPDAPVRQAVPRGSRRRGDNPQTGTAVPRGPRRQPTPAPDPNDRGRADRRRPDAGRRTVIVRPPLAYGNFDYYRRRAYPHGFGAFGLGYYYYDPYRWSPGAYPAWAGPGYHGNRWSYGFDIGELRLQVSPRHAQVFIDGYYAGTVDDYDGAFQSLKLESGPYAIQITAPGYDTLDFDVRINPGQKITYRGELRRQ